MQVEDCEKSELSSSIRLTDSLLVVTPQSRCHCLNHWQPLSTSLTLIAGEARYATSYAHLLLDSVIVAVATVPLPPSCNAKTKTIDIPSGATENMCFVVIYHKNLMQLEIPSPHSATKVTSCGSTRKVRCKLRFCNHCFDCFVNVI
jgi:hypothetical protein